MKTRFVRAALAVCLLGSAAVLATASSVSPSVAAEPAGPKVSPPVGKLLTGAKKLMEAKDFAGALVLIKQAQALPDQTPIDSYEINDFLAITAFNLNDHATADTAFEAMADSPAMPDAEKAGTLHNAALFATEAKHYDKAIKYGKALIAMGGPADAPVLGVLSQAYYFTNDFADAEAAALQSIAATAPGAAPNRGALAIALSSELKRNDRDLLRRGRPMGSAGRCFPWNQGHQGSRCAELVSSQARGKGRECAGRLHGYGRTGAAERLSGRSAVRARSGHRCGQGYQHRQGRPAIG
jgi:hypothetical protein